MNADYRDAEWCQICTCYLTEAVEFRAGYCVQCLACMEAPIRKIKFVPDAAQAAKEE